MQNIEEVDLQKILWKDFSIQKTANGEAVLILICENQQKSDELMNFLKANAFHLHVSLDKNKRYVLTLQFVNSDSTIGNNTGKTKQDYPPLGWINEGLVKYITAGIWQGKGYAIYRQDFHPLDAVNLN